VGSTCEEIAKFSAADAERYPEYEEFLQKAARLVRDLMWRTPPTSFGPRPAMEGASLLGRLQRMGHDAFGFVDLMTVSVSEFLDRWFESDQLKATLAYYGSIGTFKGPMTPGSAYVLIHHLMGEHQGAGGWGFVKGGMGGLTQALAGAARHHGATIRTEAEIAQVLIHDDRAIGVVLTDGEVFTADTIVSNIDPKTTYLRLVGREHLDSTVVEDIEGYQTFGTAFKINFALDRLPAYTAFDEERLGPYPTYVHIGPTVEYLERAYDDAKYGRPSSRPFLSPVVPTLADPDLAPEEKHILNVFGGHAPYELDGTTWEMEREAFADRVTDTLAEFAPGIRDAVIDRQILMPPDLERIYGLPQGHIFHGELTLDQLYLMRPIPGYADYRTPIEGLYLCGSGTHPGGGVFGVPGYNASREILRDTRFRRWSPRRRLTTR
ncbi:MAG: NAD(P)/FAD-dependent oxidoreductase, partial [Actinobacteria bacterium]|nr:NAD(P)/FAD-dependent oxidoreductase [Actinomycetota bacterium]